MKFFSTGFAVLALTTSLIQNVVCQNPTPRFDIPGGVQLRLNIRDLLAATENTPDGDLRNLFLVAMDRMWNNGTASRYSYYQIAAIHGSDRLYNGISSGKSNGGGYCRHGSVHFPTFHRPYMSLFEAALIHHAREFINFLPANFRPRYEQQILRLRCPYWDWAANDGFGGQLPVEFTQQTIRVRTLSTDRRSMVLSNINNPLFSYRSSNTFLQLSGSGGTVTSSVRSPVRNNGAISSRNSVTQQLLRNALANNRNDLNTIFQTVTRWTDFSNQATSGDSIETLHGSPHVNVGGYSPSSAFSGHMTRVNQAAYDPAFWFHHCNVDRQIAIWQVINPSSYLTTTQQNDPYYPFYDYRTSRYWRGSTSRNVETFNYTYPDLRATSGSANMRARMLRLYGTNSPANAIAAATTGGSRRRLVKRQRITLNDTISLDNNTVSLDNTTVAAPTGDTDLSTPANIDTLIQKDNSALLETRTTFNQYRAALSVSSGAVSGTFSVFCFIGKVSTPPANYSGDPNYVNKWDAFTEGNQMDMTIMLRKNIALEQALLNLINRKGNGLEDLSVPNVQKFLEANIEFRFVSTSGGQGSAGQFQVDIETAEVVTQAAATGTGDPQQTIGDWVKLFSSRVQ